MANTRLSNIVIKPALVCYKLKKMAKKTNVKTELESQANMRLGARSYALLNATYVSDRYGPYYDDFMLATGLGYQWFENTHVTLSTEIGPGFRYQQPNVDEIDDDDLIMPYSVSESVIRAQARGEWHMLDNVSLEGRSVVISGGSNTSVEGSLTLASTITEKLSTKITSKHTYMTDVPPGLKKSRQYVHSRYSLPMVINRLKNKKPTRRLAFYRNLVADYIATTFTLTVAKTS